MEAATPVLVLRFLLSAGAAKAPVFFSGREMSEAIGRARPTISQSLQSLERRGILRRVRGRPLRLEVTDPVAAESFLQGHQRAFKAPKAPSMGRMAEVLRILEEQLSLHAYTVLDRTALSKQLGMKNHALDGVFRRLRERGVITWRRRGSHCAYLLHPSGLRRLRRELRERGAQHFSGNSRNS